MNSDTPSREPRPSFGGALLPTLLYAVFAALWILVSDRVVAWLFSDPAQVALASTLKGWLFVAVTSLLLFALLRRRGPEQAGVAPPPPAGFRFSWPLVVLMLGIAGVTAIAITHNFSHQRQVEEARLQAIADLKVRQIGDWLRERQGDAEFVQSSAYFAEQYALWVNEGRGQAGQRLQARLEQLRRNRGFGAVSVLDPAGRRRWGSSRAPHEVAPALAEAVAQSRDGRVRRVGPYLGAAGQVRLDFVAPLTAADGATPFIVLHVDPAEWLYPMLQTWPVPSTSCETLLFRREGEQVQFLNELRHRQGTAVSLRLPLARKDMLSARVLRGEARPGELISGRDYRGMPVLGVARAVPGTDWYLLAKGDRSEIYAQARTSALWIGLSGMLALFITLAGLIMLRQRDQLAIAERTRRAEVERLRALKLLEAFANASTDAIYAKDLQGRYVLFNPAAEAMTGVPHGQVLGHGDDAVFPPETAARMRDEGLAILAEGKVWRGEKKLGERDVEVIQSPLRDESGQVIGLFGIARDITERKRAEASLRESEARWIMAIDSAGHGVWDWSYATGKVFFSPAWKTMLGYAEDEVGDSLEEWSGRVHPADLSRCMAELERHFRGETETYICEHRMRCKDGSYKWILDQGRVVARDARGQPARLIGTHTDISPVKAAEAELRRKTEELAERNAELERFNRATVGRELDMIELKKQVNALCGELGRPAPFDLDFMGKVGEAGTP